MSRSPLEYLRHILDEADYLVSSTGALTREQFLADETAKRAFARSVEVVGEAAKHVSQELRDRYPDVEWRAMAAMRDKVIHQYFGADYEIVWDVALNKIPLLRRQMIHILQAESTSHD